MFEINLGKKTLTAYEPCSPRSQCISCGCVSRSSNKRRRKGEIKRTLHAVPPWLATKLFLSKGIVVKFNHSKICNYCLEKDTVDLDIPSNQIELNETSSLKEILLILKGLTAVLANGKVLVSFRPSWKYWWQKLWWIETSTKKLPHGFPKEISNLNDSAVYSFCGFNKKQVSEVAKIANDGIRCNVLVFEFQLFHRLKVLMSFPFRLLTQNTKIVSIFDNLSSWYQLWFCWCNFFSWTLNNGKTL